MSAMRRLMVCKRMLQEWGAFAGQQQKKKYGFDDDMKQIDAWIEEARKEELNSEEG